MKTRIDSKTAKKHRKKRKGRGGELRTLTPTQEEFSDFLNELAPSDERDGPDVDAAVQVRERMLRARAIAKSVYGEAWQPYLMGVVELLAEDTERRGERT